MPEDAKYTISHKKFREIDEAAWEAYSDGAQAGDLLRLILRLLNVEVIG